MAVKAVCTAVPSIGGCGAQRVVGRLARCEALKYARLQVEGRCASYFTATALNGRPGPGVGRPGGGCGGATRHWGARDVGIKL